MRLILPVTVLLFCASCAGHDTATDPCVMRLDVVAPEPVRVGGTRVVPATLSERAGNCSNIDKEIAWKSSQSDVVDIVSTTQTSATIVARRVASSTISAWVVSTPSVRDSVTISVGPLVDN